MNHRCFWCNCIKISSILLFLLSCVDDNVQQLSEKGSGCDTVNVTYSNSVKPILKINCYSCHSTAITAATNGFDLENFSSLKDYLNYTYQNDGIYGSKFSHTINQKGTLLYMPPTSKMTDCELAIIGKWIKNGAFQN